MPPIVLQTISIIQLVAKAGPEIKALYDRVRDLVEMWFKGGVITIEQQAILMNWSDAHMAAVLAGEVPPELQVEPDPPSGV